MPRRALGTIKELEGESETLYTPLPAEDYEEGKSREKIFEIIKPVCYCFQSKKRSHLLVIKQSYGQ